MFKFLVLASFLACAYGAAVPAGMLPQLDGRIVGGAETTITSFPYAISLQRNGAHSCGGSIIATNKIVTAAHCLQNVAASALKIRAGSTYRSSGGVLVAVSSFTNNPNYNANTMVYDIAVIKLSSSLSLSSSIATIALVSTAPAAGTAATVAGWGTKTYGSSSLPEALQYVNVSIVSQSQCSSGTYGYGSEIKATMICAAATGKDACQGDSGGPLAVKDGLAGVVSWGYGCAAANYPGVYSDVAALRSWVNSTA